MPILRISLLALVLTSWNPALALQLTDFLPGGTVDSDLDPLARVQLCENDLEPIWPTAVEFARYEDVVGEAEGWIEGWRRAADPQAYLRAHVDDAVALLGRGYGMRARFDFRLHANEGGLSHRLETLTMQLESIAFFLGYVAREDELRALEDQIRARLERENPARSDVDATRALMDVLTQQAVLKSLREDGGYEVPDEVYELWRAVFDAYVANGAG